MAAEYDPYLTASTARGLYFLSIALVVGGCYLAKLSQFAWRTNTMVHIGNTGRSLFSPWEGFASAFLMIAVGIFAWSAARAKAHEWREREKNSPS